MFRKCQFVKVQKTFKNIIKAIEIHVYQSNFVTISTRRKSDGTCLFQQKLYRNQSIDLQCKSTEWFLYKYVPTENNFRKEFN